MPDDHAAAPPPPAAPAGLGTLKDFQTRFLYPFFYQRNAADRAAAALEAMKASPTPGAPPLDLWQRVPELAQPADGDRAFHAYTDELFDHVGQYLFGDPKAGGCAYLRANRAVTDAWFKGLTAEMRRGERVAPLADGAVLEVFLSPQGVGVLSVALVPKKKGLTTAEASDFNYYLAQFRRHDVGRLRRPNPKDNPAVWQRMSEADRAATRESPPADAGLPQRLGALGGWFDLKELVHHVLRPLDDRPLGRHDVQEELMVYTVARFGPEADFAREPVCDELAPLLSGLAQVEEAGHAGSRPSEVTTAHVMLNRRHWAAAGLLGSAHLISDQPGAVGFNEQKLGVIRDKYFITFLVALLRRLGLNRMVEEASARLQGATPEQEDELLESLREDQLKFALRGRFAQISCRQALHRYFLVAQEGLDVHAAWESASRALADLDAKRHAVSQRQIGTATNRSLQEAEKTAEKMRELAEGMHANLRTVANVQLKVEQIEVLIVSVYVAELWHMIAEKNEDLLAALKSLDGRYGHWFHGHEDFISWSVLFVAIFTGCWLGVALLAKWRSWWYNVVAAGAILTLMAGVFVGPWGWFFRGAGPEAGQTGTYVVATVAAVAAAAGAAYLLKPWRHPDPPGKVAALHAH